MSHYLVNLIAILVVGFIPALIVTKKMHLVRESKSPISFFAMFGLAWFTGFVWIVYMPLALLFGIITKLHYVTAYYWNRKDPDLRRVMKETPILTFDGDHHGSAVGAYICSFVAGLIFLVAAFVVDSGDPLPGQVIADHIRSALTMLGNLLTQL